MGKLWAFAEEFPYGIDLSYVLFSCDKVLLWHQGVILIIETSVCHILDAAFLYGWKEKNLHSKQT